MEQELNKYFDSTGLYLSPEKRNEFLQSKGLVRVIKNKFDYKDVCVTSAGMESAFDKDMKRIGSKYDEMNQLIDKAIYWKIKRNAGNMGALNLKGLADDINKLDKGVVTEMKRKIENDTIDPSEIDF